MLDVDESLNFCLNIGSNMSSIYSAHISDWFNRQVSPSRLSPLSMITLFYILIFIPCCVDISFSACNFLDGYQNRVLDISYTGRVSISSYLGVIIGIPVVVPLIVNFTTVLLASSFVITLPKWDQRSNFIGDVLILVSLYLTWKV